MLTKTKFYTNADISEFLTNIATAYEIKNKNRFEIIAYQNAADTVKTYPQPLYEIWQEDPKKLDLVPNIGEGIIKKLNYLFLHDKLYPSLKPIFKNIHPAVFILTKINGLGPKNAYKITKLLKFPKDATKSLDKLISYAEKHKIRNLPTFGEKSENLILENTLSFLGRKNRMIYQDAKIISDKIISYLKTNFPNTDFIPLGSLRRQSPTVGDIDIAAKSTEGKLIIECFVNYPESFQTIIKGPKKASIRIKNDVHVDIMVQPPQTFGSLLVHFTGSKMHNILLRRYALSKGLSISEYGIKNLKTKKTYTFETEPDFYNFLGLNYIEPKNRLGENEIETAKK